MNNQIAPQFAPVGMALFRFWNPETAYFKQNLEGLLERSELYLASRGNFVDPFDARPIIKNDFSLADVRAHAENLRANPSMASSLDLAAKWAWSVPKSARLTPSALRTIRQNMVKRISNFLDDLGICCFTEGMQNPILWAHYAGAYGGICVEFRATENAGHVFKNIMKVNYQSARPTIKCSQTGALQTVPTSQQDFDYITQYGICTKAFDWSVEREWRWWLPNAANTVHPVPPQSIRRIMLGPKVKPATKKLVLAVIKNSADFKMIPVFETRISESKFQVDVGTRLN